MDFKGQVFEHRNPNIHQLGNQIEQEMKKQRLKFRFYRDYFGRPEVQKELRKCPLVHYKLRLILDHIRQEIKECLYPPSFEDQNREMNKFEHLLMIESYLNRLELIKNSRLMAHDSTAIARLVVR